MRLLVKPRWLLGLSIILTLFSCVLAPGTSSASGALTLSFDSKGPHAQLSPGIHLINITFPNRVRTLIIDIPTGTNPRTRALVLVYHGALGTASETASGTDFEQDAAKGNYVVAFLQGFSDTWNEGAGHTPAEQAGVDDVAFTKAAITQIERVVNFNHAKIVASGFSNGALMVQDLGCRLSTMISAIVPVEGEIPTSVASTCLPARPVTVYEVHATGDPAIPFDGGSFAGVGGGTTVESAPESVAFWARIDGCNDSPTMKTTSTETFTSYTNCRDEREVTLESVPIDKHEWAPNVGAIVAQVAESL